MKNKIVDAEIIAIRRSWQAGLTLSQTYKRMNKRTGFNNVQKLILEWRQMKKLFGCKSASIDYVNGYTNTNTKSKITYTNTELNARISNIAGGCTYGEWKGIVGPGKQLREILHG